MNIESAVWQIRSGAFAGHAELVHKPSNRLQLVELGAVPSVSQLAAMTESAFNRAMAELSELAA